MMILRTSLFVWDSYSLRRVVSSAEDDQSDKGHQIWNDVEYLGRNSLKGWSHGRDCGKGQGGSEKETCTCYSKWSPTSESHSCQGDESSSIDKGVCILDGLCQYSAATSKATKES